MLLYFVLIVPVVSINPCLIDPGACVPLEDFEVNCTCILTHGKPINATDDVYMFFLGHQIPFKLFRQVEMPQLFRKKLQQRLPSPFDFDPALEFPEQIIRGLRVQEDMALFIVNSSYTERLLVQMANNSILKTESAKDFSKWCTEGECNIVVDSTVTQNSIGVYTHAADILQIIELRGSSVFALSSVQADFDVPKVQSQICEHRCTRFQPGDGLMCRRHCKQRMRFDHVAVIGQLKRDFQMFVRGSSVKNLRDKFDKYIG